MNFKKIAIASGILTCMTAPLSVQAEGSSLNGWAQAFSNAHAKTGSSSASGSGAVSGTLAVEFLRSGPASEAPAEQPTMQPEQPVTPDETAMEQPEMESLPESEEMPGDMAESEQPEQESSDVATQNADGTGNEAEGITGSATASLEASVRLGGSNAERAFDAIDGAYAQVNEAVDTVAGQANDALTATGDQFGNSQTVSYGGQTDQTVNVGDLASVNAAAVSTVNASVMGASQISAITATTSSVMQAALAARPATLTGLLR